MIGIVADVTICGQTCIAELEKCWRAIVSGETPVSILVDLSGLTFIDAAGKQLLAHMHEQGISFVASGLFAKFLIKEIERPGASPNHAFQGPERVQGESH